MTATCNSAATSSSYFLPALSSRFPLKANPHYTEQTDLAANAWAMSQFGKTGEIPIAVRADNFTLWAALAFPTVDAETLMTWCRFNALYTNVENRVEMAIDTGRLESAVGHWNTIVQALYVMPSAADPRQLARDASPRPEIQQCLLMTCQLAETMPAKKARHFLHCIAKMAHAQRDEYSVLATANMDIGDYIDFRYINYAIPFYLAAANGMLEQDMTEAEWQDPARAHLDLLVAKQTCLVNDLYSFQKEHRERGDRRPLVQAVTVLMEGEGLSVQDAIDRLIGLIRHYENEYLRVRDELLCRPMVSAGFREYCGRLEDIMAGNLHYMLVSPRYHGAGFTGEFKGALLTINHQAPAQAMSQAA